MAPPRVARVMRNKSFGFDSSVYSLPDTPQQQPQRRSARGRASPSSADNNTASSASLSAAGNSTAAAAGEELDQAGDGSPAPRKSKRQKTEKQHQQQQQQQQQPSPPPTSSSSPRQKQFTNVVDESSYSVAQAETPTFMRTVAMRTSLAPPPTRMSLAGLGVPQADSSRRKSVEMRGRRPSSIGGGFDTAPHPGVDAKVLHRHIDADRPPAIRLRQLFSWTARLRRDELYPRPGASSSAAAGPSRSRSARQTTKDEPTMLFAKTTIDHFIDDLARSRVDVSWTPVDDPDASIDNNPDDSAERQLPPNPLNEDNLRAYNELQERFAEIAQEQAAQDEISKTYVLFERALNGLPDPDVSDDALADVEGYDHTAALRDLDLGGPLDHVADLDAAVKLGRDLTKRSRNRRASGINRSMSSLAPSSRDDAAFVQTTLHRLRQFATLADRLATSRLSTAHDTLASLADSGLDPGASSSSSRGISLGSAIPDARPAAGAHESPRGLLRAIAKDDSRPQQRSS